MQFIIKKYSVNIAPKGNNPPKVWERKSPLQKGIEGTTRGILFVLTGIEIGVRRLPMLAPMNVSGTFKPIHMNSNTNNEKNGTAPVLPRYQINRLSMKNTVKHRPGKRKAVASVVVFQS